MSLEETTRIVERVTPAIDHAHRQNVIHRDIKPDNILFDLDGNPYISDFGVAKPATSGDSDAPATEGQFGTPGYMSPEQINNEAVDERSDVYSMGVVVYQMLSGKIPFAIDTNNGNIKPSNESIPNILNEVPELPLEMEEIIKISLADDKRDRYVTPAHFTRALRKAAFGDDGETKTFDRYGRSVAMRSSALWIIGSIAVLLAFFWMFSRGGDVPFLAAAPTLTVSPISLFTTVPSTELFNSPSSVPGVDTVLTPEATPEDGIPGGADQIALVSGNKIYLMNIDGSGLVQVRSENSPKSNLQWISGNRLVYISRNCAYLLDANTKETQKLSCYSGDEILEGFYVSPDAKFVAISVQRTLNILPFDIELLKTVTSRFELFNIKGDCFYTQFAFREVLWGKENSQLIAHVIAPRFVNSDQLFILGVDVENCVNVELSRLDTIPGARLQFESESERKVESFDWNGGNLVLFNDSIRNDGFGNFYLYDGNTQEFTKLNPINGQCCYRDVRWSPDGKYVMFAFQRFDRSDISLYYVPFKDIQSGGTFTPINIPSGLFATAREKPQLALRPVP